MDEEAEKKFLQARIDETTKKIQEEFARIFMIPHSLLSPADKAFLRARASYLTESDRREYATELAETIETDISTLTRVQLEEKAITLGIENPSDKKLYPKNSDLVNEINAKFEQ